MEEALNSDALEDFIYYDHQFHLLIVNYLHNDEFNQIFQRLLYLIHLTSQDALSTEGRIQGTVDEHLAYLCMRKYGKRKVKRNNIRQKPPGWAAFFAFTIVIANLMIHILHFLLFNFPADAPGLPFQ